MIIPPEHLNLIHTIDAYLRLNQEIVRSDCIIGLGSNDSRVAERCADLYLQGWAPKIIFTGNVGSLTRELYQASEAEHFAKIAINMGVPQTAIILETKATNTGENVKFVISLFERGALPKSAIAVQKPYMERRTFATFSKLWPELKLTVTSPQIQFDDYPLPWLSARQVVEIMVGDFQRILEYPKLGFQTEQIMPDNVLKAYSELVSAGYTGRLINGDAPLGKRPRVE